MDPDQGFADVAWPERAVRKVDEVQRRRSVTAVPVAILRKYADDRGSALAGLLTYYGFLSLLPLIVLLLTLLATLMEGRPAFRDAVLDSLLAELPVVGAQLEENARSLEAGGVWLLVGALGLLWGSLGVYNAGQLAMSQLWNVEGVDRPGFVGRLLRACALFLVLGTAAVAGGFAAHLGWFSTAPSVTRISSVLGGLALNLVAFPLVARILTPGSVPWRRLLPGTAAAAVIWEAVHTAGTWLVTERLEATGEIYGVFAYTVVAIAWINIGARLLVLSTEVNVVTSRHLWPRRLAQPPLEEADRRVLTAIVRNERRRPEQRICVHYDD